MARTMPNRVIVFNVKPAAAKTANVPSRTTGMAKVGTRVARILPKNRYMTKKTRIMASNRVLITSLMECCTNGVESIG